MTTIVRDDYLVTEVMTAAPQKLQLILIEAAIRFAVKARNHWENSQNELAGEALIRCQQILTEMMCGLRPEHNPELVRRVGGLYSFIYRTFVFAHLKHDVQKLDEAIAILELERETWREVCAELGTKRSAEMHDGQPTSFVA